MTCERTDVELDLCLSATFVLCDGFRKLGLQNTEIDAMIRRDFSRLKKVWERRFHFVPHLGNPPSYDTMRAVMRLVAPFDWHVAVHVRGNHLTLTGEQPDVDAAADAFEEFRAMLAAGVPLTPDVARESVRMLASSPDGR